MKKMVILNVLLFVCCNNIFATQEKLNEGEKGYFLYAWIDNVNVRNNPNLKSKTIFRLKEGESVKFLGEKSQVKVKLSLRGKLFNTVFFKIKMNNGEMGWVYRGALRLNNLGIDKNYQIMKGYPQKWVVLEKRGKELGIYNDCVDKYTIQINFFDKQIEFIGYMPHFFKIEHIEKISSEKIKIMGRHWPRNVNLKWSEMPIKIIYLKKLKSNIYYWKNLRFQKFKSVYSIDQKSVKKIKHSFNMDCGDWDG